MDFFSSGFGLLPDIFAVIQLSAFATIRAIFADPSLLLRPLEVRRLIMAEAWKTFGPGLDENTKDIKKRLITPHATGVVLDIGAGMFHRPFVNISSAKMYRSDF